PRTLKLPSSSPSSMRPLDWKPSPQSIRALKSSLAALASSSLNVATVWRMKGLLAWTSRVSPAPVSTSRTVSVEVALVVFLAADVPCFCRQDQSLEIIAMRPPTVPQLAHVFACRFFVDVEVGCLEETRCAEEQCLAVGNVFTQQPRRQTLREKSERQFVFLVT